MAVGYQPRSAPRVRRSRKRAASSLDALSSAPASAGESTAGPASVANFAESTDAVRVAIEREYAQRAVEAEERPRLDYLFDVDREASATRGITGRERLTKLNEALDGYGLTRSKNQRW